MDDVVREERPPPAEDGDAAADLFRALGKQVKLLRERAGLTQRELDERLGYGEEQISSLERGRRVPQPEFLAAADELLGAGGLLRTATEDVVRARAKTRVRHPAWFRDYARLEAEAVELHFYSNQIVPGLLQAEEYARAVFSMRRPLLDEETIERRVTDRLSRQTVFERWPGPVTSFVMEEVVLQRPLGGRTVRAAQLEQLLRIGRLRTVELQVMPTDREEHPSNDGAFTLLNPKERPQVAYTEVQGYSRLIVEPEEVRLMASRYGILRARALTPGESLALIEKMLGEL
ncbi:helix-turn-helix transcriptional regulator [Streptomyces sp. MI02-7b]|uniref:helix-turn-helix domain-containing protein n=1 Tax=Streptomyces sp. MI02-7b TaxID=462941 RepID=UPI0029BD2EA6|nr:helix-turn-helix transcriptional regulator [Streptomyces sp. MI02-7b]MDX3074773.1 helix-turn-helix transcriptional regulator [Streptomyces sp. MI02-7b]